MRIEQEALTFDDVLLQPAYSEILPRDVKLATRLTRNIGLNLPLVSAAMDTVTEARLAITMAQEGGIGIVHKNMTAEGQAREVARVKKFESGVITDPITVTPDKTIREVMNLTRENNISGVPVVDGKETVGIVTHRDLRFETQLDAPVSSVMTPKEKLVTVREGADKEEVLLLLHKHRIEKVLVVGDNFELKGHDYRQGFSEGQGLSRAPAKIPAARCAWAPRWARVPIPWPARRGAGRGRRRRCCRRYLSRPHARRYRYGRAYQETVPGSRRDRWQHRHRRSCRGAG